MVKKKDGSIWLLIVSGVLIAILFNLGTYRWATHCWNLVPGKSKLEEAEYASTLESLNPWDI